MYTAFYGFREKPFTLSPDPRYLFLSDTHREVLGHLIYGIEENEGFIAISGEVGTGKTTLCRTLLERLSRDAEVAFLFNPHLSPADLLREIHAEFDLGSQGDSLPDLTRNLYAFLVEKKRQNRQVLLIIDEAQTLPVETLEQVRLLSNLETSREKLLQIVLLGQPELDEKLSIPELRQLRQRIGVWWHLGPLTQRETHDYVLHRLRIAGAQDDVFDASALASIHAFAKGVPRVINVLCDRALLAGYAAGKRAIGRKLVLQAAQEIGPSGSEKTARRPRRAFARAAVAFGVVAGLVLGGALLRPGGISLQWQPIVADAPPETAPPPVARVEAEPPLEYPPEPPVEASAVQATPVPASFSGEAILDALLPAQTSIATIEASSDATLEAWRLPPREAPFQGLADALTGLRAQGLQLLGVEFADLSTLEEIDLPVWVRLRAEDGIERWALLRAAVGDRVELQGLLPQETIRVDAVEFRTRWTGDALVPWRDFEALPRVLEPGQRGASVRWLQASLRELGFLTLAESGVFDTPTLQAVRAFQRSSALTPDGRVGPRTKIQLYRALPRYANPVLRHDPVPAAPAG